MNYSINKLWILPIIIGTSLSLFLVVTTQTPPQSGLAQRSTPLSPNDSDTKLDPNLINVPAMPEQNTDSSQRYPLSPNDPDAKLDPNLINAPAMPEQTTEPSRIRPTQTPDQEVNYDPRTGATGVGETTVKPSPQPSGVNEPNRGADAK